MVCPLLKTSWNLQPAPSVSGWLPTNSSQEIFDALSNYSKVYKQLSTSKLQKIGIVFDAFLVLGGWDPSKARGRPVTSTLNVTCHRRCWRSFRRGCGRCRWCGRCRRGSGRHSGGLRRQPGKGVGPGLLYIFWMNSWKASPTFTMDQAQLGNICIPLDHRVLWAWTSSASYLALCYFSISLDVKILKNGLHTYPLVNVCVTMEHHHAING